MPFLRFVFCALFVATPNPLVDKKGRLPSAVAPRIFARCVANQNAARTPIVYVAPG